MILLSIVLLSASVAFAATDDNATIAEVNDEIAIDEDVLSIAEDNVVLQDSETPIVGNSTSAESPVVTNDTFFNYFDETGLLLNTTTSDELIFDGDFSGINVSSISINKAIKFTGNNATFSGVTFAVNSDNVTIDGFTLSQDKNIALILMYCVDNVVISNNVIDFKVSEGHDSYAIWADTVDNLKLINNTITYVGNTTGSTINSAVRVEGDKDVGASRNITVDGNKFIIKIPSTEITYDDYWLNSIVHSSGISFVYCEDVQFINNDVSLAYTTFDLGEYGADTIYVVHVSSILDMDWDEGDTVYYRSDNILISNNTINAFGHNYTYGIVVSADNIEISDNIVNASSELRYAAGIDIESPSANGTVKDNTVYVNAKDVVYGIYSYAYMGPIENMVYDDNVIMGKAYAACGMELVNVNPIISDNFIALGGNHTTGITADITSNGTISGNEIFVSGTNLGTTPSGDGMVHLESTGINVKGNTLIINNTIESTSIGVNLILGGEFTLTDNSINVTAQGVTDNYGVYADGVDALVITGNDISFSGYTNGTIYSNGMFIDGIDDVEIKDNRFDISLVSANVIWVEEPEGSWNYVKYPVTEGIVIKNSDGVKFDNNNVKVSYSNFTGDSDTIYVIDLADSPNSVISNNEIVATGYTYIYGIIVTSANFIIENNTIYSVADGYCAYAINPDAGANGVVKNNTLAAIAPDVAYTIYSMMYGDVTGMNIDYIGNQLYGNAYYVNVFDIGGANENIINNTIIAEGNYTIAVYSGSANNTFSGNTIRALGSGEGNKTIPYTVNEIEAIKLAGANAVISDNYIESTGDIAVDLGNTDSVISDSYVSAKKSVGRNAIANAGSGAVIANITPGLKTVLAAVDLHSFYDDNDVYYVCALDENGDPISNVTIQLMFNDGTNMTEVTDANGIAPFYMDIDAGEYSVVALFAGNDVYGPKSIDGSISISPRPTEIDSASTKTVLVTTIKNGYTYKVTVVDYMNIGVAGKSVAVTFNGKTKNYTTDENGVINCKLVASKIGTKKVSILFKDSNYVEASATATIKITKETAKITATKKSYKANVKTKKFTVTLKDSKGKVIKNTKLTLTVKGKTYKATTNSKGKATFKITKLTKIGSHTAKIKLVTNNYYKASVKSVKITVKK